MMQPERTDIVIERMQVGSKTQFQRRGFAPSAVKRSLRAPSITAV
jgi:hypothetical protein